MFEHTEMVRLAGKEYPIRCDINVLIEIQEKFETVSNFEMLIAGVIIAKDEDGNVLTDKNGKILFERCDPSLRAIAEILPCMLSEAHENRKDQELARALDAVKNAKFDLYSTAVQISKELSKCFERKNVSSVRGTRKPKTKK